jgi:hypothetical protein
MVDVAANMAQAASTALPPRLNVSAPAVAAKGLPVIAIQCEPCKTGLTVRCAMAGALIWASRPSKAAINNLHNERVVMGDSRSRCWEVNRPCKGERDAPD